jgi:hypothetical protein
MPSAVGSQRLAVGGQAVSGTREAISGPAVSNSRIPHVYTSAVS